MSENTRKLTVDVDIKLNQETVDQLTAIAKTASTLAEQIAAFTAEYETAHKVTRSDR